MDLQLTPNDWSRVSSRKLMRKQISSMTSVLVLFISCLACANKIQFPFVSISLFFSEVIQTYLLVWELTSTCWQIWISLPICDSSSEFLFTRFVRLASNVCCGETRISHECFWLCPLSAFYMPCNVSFHTISVSQIKQNSHQKSNSTVPQIMHEY